MAHMVGTRAKRAQSLAVAYCLLATACAAAPAPNPRDIADANDTGRKLPPSARDRALLQELAGVPAGTPRRVGDVTVMAEAPYAAASGRSCRALQITQVQQQRAEHRLACSEGSDWFFVPDVFGNSRLSE